MITVIVTVLKEAGLVASVNTAETTLLRTPDKIALTPPLVVEEAGQRYLQTAQLF